MLLAGSWLWVAHLPVRLATLMDAAGHPRAAADQLGHAHVSMTQDHYFGRRVAITGAATVLESIADATADQPPLYAT